MSITPQQLMPRYNPIWHEWPAPRAFNESFMNYASHICVSNRDEAWRVVTPITFNLNEYSAFAPEVDRIAIPMEKYNPPQGGYCLYYHYNEEQLIRDFNKRIEIAMFDNESYVINDERYGNLEIKPFLNGEHNHYHSINTLCPEMIQGLIRDVNEHSDNYESEVYVCVHKSLEKWFNNLSPRWFVPRIKLYNNIFNHIPYKESEPDRYRDSFKNGHIFLGMFADRYNVWIKPYIPEDFLAIINYGDENNRPFALRVSEDTYSYGVAPIRRDAVACLAYNVDEYYYIETE